MPAGYFNPISKKTLIERYTIVYVFNKKTYIKHVELRALRNVKKKDKYTMFHITKQTL
jgi:hypothetical protein